MQCLEKPVISPTRSLALLRGGAGSDEASVFTLFVRVFLPKFRRERLAREDEEVDGLDLEGGGLMKRLGRLLSGVVRNIPGFSGKLEAAAKAEERAMDVFFFFLSMFCFKRTCGFQQLSVPERTLPQELIMDMVYMLVDIFCKTSLFEKEKSKRSI